MTERHTVGCSFPPCEYNRRKSWRFTCARHRGEQEKPKSVRPSKAADLAYIEGMRDGYAEGRREMLWLMAVAAVVQFDQDCRAMALLHAQGASTNHDHAPMVRAATVALRALGRDVHGDLFDMLRDYGGTKWALEMLR